ncbi:MAG: protein-glutamate O-methyltransferase CheR [Rhodothermales bacterium]|nr:protein-glutamate O-methyltransferase CheR [Rhodothermales bacterium]
MSLLDRIDLGGGPSALSGATFEALSALIYERSGIRFRDNKRYLLESRLTRRLEALGLDGFEAYLGLLRSPRGHAEFDALFNAVTINETFFFRHADQHRHFARELLPELIERRLRAGGRRVRLWSAACSTGDEPYTLALLIQEEVQARYPAVAFDIVGTDINTEVLAQAREGLYEAYAVRTIPAPLRQRYFREEAGPRGPRYRLDARLRRMVRFQRLNLIERASPSHPKDVDAVFCANVLIYFDAASKQAAAANLYDALRPGGYLLVGTSETLYGVTQAFQPVRSGRAVAYLKPPPTSAPSVAAAPRSTRYA